MNLQDIYQDLNRCLKDMEFFDTERKFLEKVIQVYFKNSGSVSPKSLENLDKQLYQLEIDIHSLRDDILSTQTEAELIIKKLIDRPIKLFLDQHLALKQRKDNLFGSLRQFKQELFKTAIEI